MNKCSNRLGTKELWRYGYIRVTDKETKKMESEEEGRGRSAENVARALRPAALGGSLLCLLRPVLVDRGAGGRV